MKLKHEYGERVIINRYGAILRGTIHTHWPDAGQGSGYYVILDEDAHNGLKTYVRSEMVRPMTLIEQIGDLA